MCGRYTLTAPSPKRIRARFDLDSWGDFPEQARYNIAPTDSVLAIRRSRDGAREPGRLRWGLVPARWAERRSGPPLINARAETVASQPAFAESFRERRCLIPADGFYEWRHDERGKTPVWISRPDGDLFAFAGIWAALESHAGSDPLHSCAIVTCEPNALIRPIHDRMPVVLSVEGEAAWLDPELAEPDLASLLAPAPADLLVTRDVGDAVNDVREDGPHLIDAREPQPQLF
ncbi:MAG: SOS response-associated peptidase [Solirubrobacterales bacterium]